MCKGNVAAARECGEGLGRGEGVFEQVAVEIAGVGGVVAKNINTNKKQAKAERDENTPYAQYSPPARTSC